MNNDAINNQTAAPDDAVVAQENPVVETEEQIQPVEEQTGNNNVAEEQTTDTKSAADETVEESPAEGQDSVVAKTVDETPAEESAPEEQTQVSEEKSEETSTEEVQEEQPATDAVSNPNARWYVVHTFSGHENRVATSLKQRIESEHLEHKIFDILVPTQDKIEIRSGKKEQVKEKIFPGYILVKMDLDDLAWLAVRTTPGVTGFVGMSNKPTPIPEREVQSIVRFMTQGAAPTFKDVFLVDDTVRIIDGPFADFIGKVESVDKEKGKVRVLVSIFGRETPVELDFLQVTKL